MTFLQSTMLWCIVFALIGAHTYVLDKKIGIKVHAKWRKWTSPNGEPKGSPDRGFIYNRSNKVRWFWASIIAGINFATMIGWRHEDPRIEIMNFFLITPATMIGFMVGPWYLRFKQKREELFTTLDEVESGKIDVSDNVRSVAQKKLSTLGRLFDRFISFFTGLVPKKKEVPIVKYETPVVTPINPQEEEKAAREALRKFTER